MSTVVTYPSPQVSLTALAQEPLKVSSPLMPPRVCSQGCCFGTLLAPGLEGPGGQIV